MLRRRLLVPTLITIAAGLALLATGGGGAAAAPASTSGKTYVALGDSYAAGFGLPATVASPTGKPVAGCDQTSGDYPHLLAARLGLTLTDVTCSGATTADFTASQSVTGGSAPPQLDVFKTVQPDLVTITIGGNDLGFTSIAQNCLAATPAGPLLSHPSYASCKAYFASSAAGGGSADDPYASLAGVIAKVKAAIAAVQSAAPKAKIAVIAYPAIAPDAAHTPSGGCFVSLEQSGLPGGLPSVLPFTDVDVPYLQVLQQDLDAGIGQAAAQLGASYADIYPSSLAHSACQPESTRWVEPVVPGDGGTNVLHPNIAGTTAMADALVPVVTGLLTPVTSTSAPAPTATTSAAGSSSAASASSAPLAATGPSTRIGSTVWTGGLLVVAGATLLAFGRRARRRGAHR